MCLHVPDTGVGCSWQAVTPFWCFALHMPTLNLTLIRCFFVWYVPTTHDGSVPISTTSVSYRPDYRPISTCTAVYTRLVSILMSKRSLCFRPEWYDLIPCYPVSLPSLLRLCTMSMFRWHRIDRVQ